jgi:hypothetical protein
LINPSRDHADRKNEQNSRENPERDVKNHVIPPVLDLGAIQHTSTPPNR